MKKENQEGKTKRQVYKRGGGGAVGGQKRRARRPDGEGISRGKRKKKKKLKIKTPKNPKNEKRKSEWLDEIRNGGWAEIGVSRILWRTIAGAPGSRCATIASNRIRNAARERVSHWSALEVWVSLQGLNTQRARTHTFTRSHSGVTTIIQGGRVGCGEGAQGRSRGRLKRCESTRELDIGSTRPGVNAALELPECHPLCERAPASRADRRESGVQ